VGINVLRSNIQIVFRAEGGRLIEEQTGAFISTNVRYVQGDSMIMVGIFFSYLKAIKISYKTDDSDS